MAVLIMPLVLAAQHGQAAALASLFVLFQPHVRRVLRLYRHLPIAEDLEGEAFLAFAKLVREYEPGRKIPFESYAAAKFRLLLHSVVRREYTHCLRERATGVEAELFDRPVFCPHDLSTQPLLFGESIAVVCDILTPLQADVFLRRALQEQPYESMSGSLHCSPGTLRVHFHAARQRLRRIWAEPDKKQFQKPKHSGGKLAIRR